MPPPAKAHGVACLVLALALTGVQHDAARAESWTPASYAPLVHLTRYDAWYGLAAAAGVGALGFADRGLRARAIASDRAGARRLARVGRALGAPEVLGPALLLGYVGGRVLDHPGFATASGRVAASVAVAGATAGALKLAVGRVRPVNSAQESDQCQPFSRHASFPSGHTTLAFASAAALDRETESRWVPWVVYPLAGLVGWSRVRDDQHWASDVVAGAALGFWTARKTEHAMRVRASRSERLGVMLRNEGRDVRLSACLSF